MENHILVDEEKGRQQGDRKCLCSCTTRCCCRSTTFFLSHFGMTSFVLLYLVLGAAVFTQVERPEEMRLLEEQRREYLALRDEFAVKLYQLTNLNNQTTIRDLLAEYSRQFNCWDFRVGDDEQIKPEDAVWQFLPAFIFCLSIVTTIGYGHIVPLTVAGRALTIVYAIIGIPCTGIALSNIGTVSAAFARVLFQRAKAHIHCCCCRGKRKPIVNVMMDALMNEETSIAYMVKKNHKGTVEDSYSVSSGSDGKSILQTLNTASEIISRDKKDKSNNSYATNLSRKSSLSNFPPPSDNYWDRLHVITKFTSLSSRRKSASTSVTFQTQALSKIASSDDNTAGDDSVVDAPSIAPSRAHSRAPNRAPSRAPSSRAPTSLAPSRAPNIRPALSLIMDRPRSPSTLSPSFFDLDLGSSTLTPVDEYHVDEAHHLMEQKKQLLKLVRLRRQLRHLEREERRRRQRQEVVEKYSVPLQVPDIPIAMSVLLLVTYVFLGGVVFSLWTQQGSSGGWGGGGGGCGWDVLVGCYFSFTTLTTIGFGDFLFGGGSRNHHHSGTTNDFHQNQEVAQSQLVATAVYILFGLSLASMCIDLMHDSIRRRFHEVRAAFFENFEQYQVRVEKRESLKKQERPPEHKAPRKKSIFRIMADKVTGKGSRRYFEDEIREPGDERRMTRSTVGETGETAI